jgi:hypothetical protein
MALNDGDIAALAREAADHVALELAVRIEPLGQNDPYRLGRAAWLVHAGGRRSYVTADLTWRQALDKLIADLAP